jgi:hypothetical protein
MKSTQQRPGRIQNRQLRTSSNLQLDCSQLNRNLLLSRPTIPQFIADKSSQSSPTRSPLVNPSARHVNFNSARRAAVNNHDRQPAGRTRKTHFHPCFSAHSKAKSTFSPCGRADRCCSSRSCWILFRSDRTARRALMPRSRSQY